MADHRELGEGQRCEVWVAPIDGGEPRRVLTTTEILLEAPNWSGDTLYVNGDGVLWSIDLRSDEPTATPVRHTGLPPINNDHVLDPDGRHVWMSARDGHIHRGGLEGGPVDQITTDDGVWHFLHGISPDGERLAYVRMTGFDRPGRLAVLGPDGRSTLIDTGSGHLDGPEWSPDGAWLYVNTEAFTSAPGHAQIARLPDGGGPLERLTTSDTVDWFPHLSPDGRYATYVAFPPGTLGHPADVDVEIRLVELDDWATPLLALPVFGGQGTLNVNSWSPDSRHFAYVTYPR